MCNHLVCQLVGIGKYKHQQIRDLNSPLMLQLNQILQDMEVKSMNGWRKIEILEFRIQMHGLLTKLKLVLYIITML